MFVTKISIEKCVLLIGLVVYFSNQVTSLKCYDCTSDEDGECFKNPKQPKYEKTCDLPDQIEDIVAAKPSAKLDLNNPPLNYTLKKDYKKVDTEWVCGILRVTGQIPDSAIRSCLPANSSCKELKDFYERNFAVALKACSLCKTDLCNAENLK